MSELLSSNPMGMRELLEWAYNINERFDVMPADWKLRTKNLLASPDETSAPTWSSEYDAGAWAVTRGDGFKLFHFENRYSADMLVRQLRKMQERDSQVKTSAPLCDCDTECVGPDARADKLCRAEEGKLCKTGEGS